MGSGIEQAGLPEMGCGLFTAGRIALKVEVSLNGTDNGDSAEHLHSVEYTAIAREQDMNVGAAISELPVHREGKLRGFAVPVDLSTLIAVMGA